MKQLDGPSLAGWMQKMQKMAFFFSLQASVEFGCSELMLGAYPSNVGW
jgi:hypothetical protein